jgi:membrane protease YdiL (CAAX protease family)
MFTAVFVVLVAVHEGLYELGGMGEAGSPWRKYGPAALALRVLFVGLVYSFAEELFFRGFILGLTARKAGAWIEWSGRARVRGR